MNNPYHKPLQSISIREHLRMLSRYCKEQAVDDKVETRREALLVTAEKLRKLAESRPVVRLLDYGE